LDYPEARRLFRHGRSVQPFRQISLAEYIAPIGATWEFWEELRGRERSGNDPEAAELISTTLRNEHTMPTHHIAALRGEVSLDPATCPACGSPAFFYPRVLDDDKPVMCAGCGAFISTYGEMRQRFDNW
jgi:hypothetical protein